MSIKQLYVFLLMTLSLSASLCAVNEDDISESARTANQLSNTGMIPSLYSPSLIKKKDFVYVVIGIAVLVGSGYIIKKKNILGLLKKKITRQPKVVEQKS
jgi:hypothetical protein